MGLFDLMKAMAEIIGGTLEVSLPHYSEKHGEHYDMTIKDSSGKIVMKVHVPSCCQPDFDDPDFQPGKYSGKQH